MANDKDLMASYARSIGVDVPDVIEWDTWDELEGKLRASDFRVVVKLRRGYSSRWVFYPKDAAEALTLCKGLVAEHRLGPDQLPMVQRLVEGEKWGVACLYHDGNVLATFTQKMLRQKPATGGASTLRVSARNATIEEYSKRLLDGLQWHGIAMMEFICDRVSGKSWFIEVNPRLWSSIHLAVSSGIDLVALCYIASTVGPEAAVKMSRPQRNDVLCRWWLGDVALAISEAKRMRPFSALKSILPGGTDVYDEFRADDLCASAGAIAGPVAGLLGRKPKWAKSGKSDSPYLNFNSGGFADNARKAA